MKTYKTIEEAKADGCKWVVNCGQGAILGTADESVIRALLSERGYKTRSYQDSVINDYLVA